MIKFEYTSIDSLLDPPAVSIVAAVPQLVPELVFALHQPLLRPKRHRLHRLRPLGAHVPAGQTRLYANKDESVLELRSTFRQFYWTAELRSAIPRARKLIN